MEKYRVLITPRSFAKTDDSPIELLNSSGCETVRITGDKEEVRRKLFEQLPVADAVIAGLEEYDRSLLLRADKLRVISRYGVGYDRIDLKAASERNIAVTITPGANDDSVADMAMALMLAAARNVSYIDFCIKNNNEQRPLGVEMWKKTLGVVGAGRIGKGVVRRAKGFEMKILCYDQYRDDEFAKAHDMQYVDFDTLLKESDFITIHTPLNDQTRNLFAAEQFRRMKKTAVLVNAARGGIVSETDLYEALKNGVIGAAALDATEKEPPYGNPLLSLPNVTVTPHMGASTIDAVSRMGMIAAQNVLDILFAGKSANSIKMPDRS